MVLPGGGGCAELEQGTLPGLLQLPTSRAHSDGIRTPAAVPPFGKFCLRQLIVPPCYARGSGEGQHPTQRQHMRLPCLAEPSRKVQPRPALNPPSLVQIPGGTSGGVSCPPAHGGLSPAGAARDWEGNKSHSPPPSGDIFAKLCHGVGQVWAVARGHKANQPPRAGGDRRAVKPSWPLQAGECRPCRTVTSFSIATASPEASGTAVESYELSLRRSFVVHSPHR